MQKETRAGGVDKAGEVVWYHARACTRTPMTWAVGTCGAGGDVREGAADAECEAGDRVWSIGGGSDASNVASRFGDKWPTENWGPASGFAGNAGMGLLAIQYASSAIFAQFQWDYCSGTYTLRYLQKA